MRQSAIQSVVVMAGVALLGTVGCDDGATSSGGAGGATSSSTTSDSSSGSTTTSTSVSTGSTTTTCVDGSTYASLFTILAPEFCAVAVYSADESGIQAPTWGSHGGPVTVRSAADGGADVARWTVPAGATGSLVKQEIHFDAIAPPGAFLGAQAVDLGFFGWTAISWSGAFPDTAGEIVMLKDGVVAKRFPLNAPFALAGLGANDATGRLLYTGLSAIPDAMSATNGLYAADACGAGPTADLLPGANPMCGDPLAIAAWGDFSGPVAVDHAGNAFVVNGNFAGDQEARGFAAPTIAHGGAPVAGTTVFSLPGFGSALAAVAPSGGAPGVLAFQPYDGTTFDALDVAFVPYTATASDITPSGSLSNLLSLTTPNTPLGLMIDDQDRIWVSGATATTTTFVVLQRSR